MEFVDLKIQYQKYKEDIDARIQAVLDHAHFIMGPEVAELEQILANYVGVKHCLTVASGTDSLEIALRALNIGPGDEVITVPFTWISTAEVIGLVGARPIFVDIEPETYNIDIGLIEKAITSRTRAIIPVSLFGQMPDYIKINALCASRGITVIEDAAQSFGATQRAVRTPGSRVGAQATEKVFHRSGSMTTIASTSFFPAKPFGCYGDGGALFTDDDILAETMRAIRSHGGSKRHHHTLLGMNGRFDTLQAAVLLAKFRHFDEEVRERARIGARYTDALRGTCGVPEVLSINTHVYAQYTIRIPDRDAAASHLKALGIPTAVYYPKCLHEQPVFASLQHRLGDYPEAVRASRQVLSLPMHPFLSEKDQDSVINGVFCAVANSPVTT